MKKDEEKVSSTSPTYIYTHHHAILTTALTHLDRKIISGKRKKIEVLLRTALISPPNTQQFISLPLPRVASQPASQSVSLLTPIARDESNVSLPHSQGT